MVVKRLVICGLFLVFCCLHESLFSIISFIAIDKTTNNSKTFIRIGENHRISYRKSDPSASVEIRDNQAILKLINESALSKRKVCVLIEANSCELDSIKMTCERLKGQGYEIGLIYSLVELAEKNCQKLKSVSFDYFDKLRGCATSEFANVWYSLIDVQHFKAYFVSPLIEMLKKNQSLLITKNLDLLSYSPTPKNLDTILNLDQQIKNDCSCFKSWKYTFENCGLADCSVDDFFNELDDAKRIISQTLLTLDPLSKEYFILQSHISSIDSAYLKALAFYKHYISEQDMNKKGTCFKGIYDALNATSFSSVCSQYKEWVCSLLSVTADASMFIEILKAFKEFDVVISISGAAHARECQNICDCLDIKSIFKKQGKYEDLSTGQFSSIFSDLEFKHYIGEIIKAIIV